MEIRTITQDDIQRLRSAAKKAGIRNTCAKADISIDTYWNIVYGRSRNREAFDTLFNAAVDLIIEEDDHNE